ncbi:MAG: hypothetical protein CVV57_10555 [Tenericutes bacterium HGW-Tenericutes-2]|jgi:prepilin signal peptidase PulO-like enzyme (type II secretory pathway)|nr:MAG: hypothetical protein CVV57_10555 [Tenericutes bacterium HGW-Tenericutes-2]PKL00448.1 MAG: hypothetical protein CVV56_06165 [Tenericutes bacterium HGW-Tenericutes-1]
MTAVYSILFFLFGSLLASFIQLVAYRLPHKETLLGRSYCPNCHVDLRFIDVLPIIGYLINKGKCHFCHEKISISYLITELIGGFLFVISYLLIGFELELIVALIMILVLLAESLSDINQMIVIDKLWMIGIIPIIIVRIIQGSFTDYLISSLVMFGLLFLILFLGKLYAKKEVLGGGDVKLYLFIGFVLLLPESFLSLFLASIFGVIFATARKKAKSSYLPLVPFIFLGVLVSYFFGSALIQWYLSLLGM